VSPGGRWPPGEWLGLEIERPCCYCVGGIRRIIRDGLSCFVDNRVVVHNKKSSDDSGDGNPVKIVVGTFEFSTIPTWAVWL
jgi:hypothetical protein